MERHLLPGMKPMGNHLIDLVQADHISMVPIETTDETRWLSPAELIRRVPIKTEEKLNYLEDIYALLGDETTYKLQKEDEYKRDSNIEYNGKLIGDESQIAENNLRWLKAISEGRWLVSKDLEDHDMGNHYAALVLGGKAQAYLMQKAAEDSLSRRLEQISKGEDARANDIKIPPRFMSSERGEPLNSNVLGLIDYATEGGGGIGNPMQVEYILKPMMEGDFKESIQNTYTSILEQAEAFLKDPNERMQSSYGLGVGLAEYLKRSSGKGDLTNDEVKIVVSEVLKGYMGVAAKLRGEQLPDEAQELFPLGENGVPLKATIAELVESYSGVSDEQARHIGSTAVKLALV